MKNLLTLAVALLTISTVAAQQQFTIKGQVCDSSWSGLQVFLQAGEVTDTATVQTDGTFVLKGVVKEPIRAEVVVHQKYRAWAIAEKGTVNIKFHEYGYDLSGTPLNEKYQNILDKFADQESPERIREIALAKYDGATSVGAMLLLHVTPMLTMSDIDSLLNVSGAIVLKDPLVKTLQASNNAKRNTSPGRMFVDFDATLPNGTETKLSDYVGRGKWVLVDFWASWCGPCRSEIPFVADIHKNYADQVTVLGVNVWDREESAVVAAAQLDITWSNIAVYQGPDKNSATTAYGIQGLPTLILFAPDGTIVNRTLRGAEIEEVLKKQLTK